MRVRHVIAIGLGLVSVACGDDLPTGLPPHGSSSAGTSTTGTTETTAASGGPSSSTETSAGRTEDSGPGSSSTDGTDGRATGTGPQVCEAPARVVPCDSPRDDPSPLQAMGLGCDGEPDETVALEASSFSSRDPDAWRVARRLGTHDDPETGEPTWGAQHGEQVLMISTGTIGPVDDQGAVVMEVLEQDANDNPDDKPLPAPMTELRGSGGIPFTDCDGVGDCSDSLWNPWLGGGAAAMDLLWFQLRTAVPAGTHGFHMDFALLSEEFPGSVGTPFNDMFVVWSSSETYVGNLCVAGGQPCTVTGLWPVQYAGASPELVGTGFGPPDTQHGGGTGWLQVRGSAAPGESLELTFALFDMGDEELDTLVLLDGFAWDCDGCTLSADGGCGVAER